MEYVALFKQEAEKEAKKIFDELNLKNSNDICDILAAANYLDIPLILEQSEKVLTIAIQTTKKPVVTNFTLSQLGIEQSAFKDWKNRQDVIFLKLPSKYIENRIAHNLEPERTSPKIVPTQTIIDWNPYSVTIDSNDKTKVIISTPTIPIFKEIVAPEAIVEGVLSFNRKKLALFTTSDTIIGVDLENNNQKYLKLFANEITRQFTTKTARVCWSITDDNKLYIATNILDKKLSVYSANFSGTNGDFHLDSSTLALKIEECPNRPLIALTYDEKYSIVGVNQDNNEFGLIIQIDIATKSKKEIRAPIKGVIKNLITNPYKHDIFAAEINNTFYEFTTSNDGPKPSLTLAQNYTLWQAVEKYKKTKVNWLNGQEKSLYETVRNELENAKNVPLVSIEQERQRQLELAQERQRQIEVAATPATRAPTSARVGARASATTRISTRALAPTKLRARTATTKRRAGTPATRTPTPDRVGARASATTRTI